MELTLWELVSKANFQLHNAWHLILLVSMNDPTVSHEVVHHSGAISDINEKDLITSDTKDSYSDSDDSGSDMTPPPSILPKKPSSSYATSPKMLDTKKQPPLKKNWSAKSGGTTCWVFLLLLTDLIPRLRNRPLQCSMSISQEPLLSWRLMGRRGGFTYAW